MNHQALINRLVAQKPQAGAIKFGCVPCFGAPPHLLAANKPPASSNPKK
jgi:hypothetical protein